MNTLATFIHVSDLHIGDIDPATGDASAPKLWAKFPYCDGLLGHERAAMKRLEVLWRNERREDPEAHLIVTGDLTTWAKNVHFDTCDQFLSGDLSLKGEQAWGLFGAQWKRFGISGNHDKWDGAPMLCGPTMHYQMNVMKRDRRPFTNETLTLSDRKVVRFIGIDTDADVGFVSRWKARGSFISQLREADKQLNRLESTDEIRVLLMHHSMSNGTGVLGIKEASRQRLLQFVGKHGIAIVLSGHAHKPTETTFQTTLGPATEIRCGTTTQRYVMPFDWLTLKGNCPELGEWPQTCVRHRIVRAGAAYRWEYEVLVGRYEGFVHKGRTDDEAPLSGVLPL